MSGSTEWQYETDASVKAIRGREDLKMGYWSMNAALQDERRFGREEGREEGRLSMVIELVKEGILTIKQAADRMQMTVPELEAEMAMNA